MGNNKLKGIENILSSHNPRIDKNFYYSKFRYDTKCLENYNDTKKINTINLLGQDTFTDEKNNTRVILEGNIAHINGFMVKNDNEYNDFIFRKTSLNKYQRDNLYSWKIKDEDINVSILEDNIFKKDEVIKVCIKDGINKIEVLGKIKSVKRNFIYVEPEDKEILEDNQILEFDIESKNLKIDKINEIKSSKSNCVNDNKLNIFLFNQEDKKVNNLNIKNILEQILPSIYQLITRNKFKNITLNEDIDRILSFYGFDFNDLEFSNYQILREQIKKNVKKIQKIMDKKLNKLNKIKRTFKKVEEINRSKNLSNNFDISNDTIDELNKIYENYTLRGFSFDSSLTRTTWIINQEDNGKYFSLFLKYEYLKSLKLDSKKELFLKHKEQLLGERDMIDIKLQEEIRKNDFFNNPDNICKQDLTNKISKIYLSIKNLLEDNNRDILVDPQFKTILDEEMVRIGHFCILKDSNNPTIDINLVDMNDRIFERIINEAIPSWKEKNKGFLKDFISDIKKSCKDKKDCDFSSSFGPCEPENVKRLKDNKNKNKIKLDNVTKKITEIDNKELERKIEGEIEFYKKKNLLNKSSDILDILNTDERIKLLNILKEKYDIDTIDLEKPDDKIEETSFGDFNENGQRIVHHEEMGDTNEIIEMTDNEILDSVRFYLEGSKTKDFAGLDEDFDIIKNIISIFIKIFGISIKLKGIEFKCLSIFNQNFKISLLQFKKKQKGGKNLEEKYNKLKKTNIIYYTSATLLIELQIILNNYFLSHYEKCISSIDGYPIIPKDEKDNVGERFNYGINFITCILNNLKNSGGYWDSIKKEKKIKKI